MNSVSFNPFLTAKIDRNTNSTITTMHKQQYVPRDRFNPSPRATPVDHPGRYLVFFVTLPYYPDSNSTVNEDT